MIYQARLELLDVNNPAHVKAMYEIRTHPDVAKYLTHLPPVSFSAHEKYLQTVDLNQRKIFIIMTNEEVCGYCQGFLCDEEVELGWALHPNYWGKGIGTQAVQLLLEQVRKEPLLMNRKIVLYVKKENVRAITLYEQHGFSITGIDPIRDEYIMRENLSI